MDLYGRSLGDCVARSAPSVPASMLLILTVLPLEGTSTYWAEMLVSLALELRFDAFIFWPQEMSREQVERFAHEIAPAVREALAKEQA